VAFKVVLDLLSRNWQKHQSGTRNIANLTGEGCGSSISGRAGTTLTLRSFVCSPRPWSPTAAQELTRLPSAVSISLARLRIFWSHAEESTRFQPIFVRKARPTAPVSMPYSTVRRKNRIYMWPLQVDL